MIKVLLIVGARPNFMKAAPVLKEMQKYPSLELLLVHTGQHYDAEMSDSFFTELDLPKPDIYLGVGSGSHASQTGKIMIAFEKVVSEKKPDLVVVVGDVNSTLACALVSSKLGIKIAHVEAGLRSFDRTMPEEINRVLTDQISDFLFTTCEDADVNLQNEGIAREKVFFVGNVMIDTLRHQQKLAEDSGILERLELRGKEGIKKYALLTLHRPSNVDNRETLDKLLDVLNELNRRIPVVFPAHPRTVKQLKAFELEQKADSMMMISPLGYLEFLHLMSHASLVLTDSGGIQEETTILGVPCLTLRENTERPITMEQGTNHLVGKDPEKIRAYASEALERGAERKSIPKYWDGKAAGRIAKILANTLS